MQKSTSAAAGEPAVQNQKSAKKHYSIASFSCSSESDDNYVHQKENFIQSATTFIDNLVELNCDKFASQSSEFSSQEIVEEHVNPKNLAKKKVCSKPPNSLTLYYHGRTLVVPSTILEIDLEDIAPAAEEMYSKMSSFERQRILDAVKDQ